jgi:hypothetical protein
MIMAVTCMFPVIDAAALPSRRAEIDDVAAGRDDLNWFAAPSVVAECQCESEFDR